MTREEALKIIDDECEHIKHHLTQKGKAEEFYSELGNMVIAFNMAIKLLKQEPFEDVINRILKRMWNCRGKHTTSIDKVKMEQILRDELSSVNPEPKTREDKG